MSSPGIVMREGSEVGSHRGGFAGIDFNSLILFDMCAARTRLDWMRGHSASESATSGTATFNNHNLK